MTKLKAVIFDIDGTLTPQNSWKAFTNDLGGDVDKHLSIYGDHLKGKIGLDESKKQLLELWQATGNANKDHIEKVFDSWPIRDEARELVTWLKERGIIICLITGSVGVYAKHVAEKLGVDHWFANAELYFDADGKLENFHYTANQAEIKLEQFTSFCAEQKLKLTDCLAVGDWDNDIDLFRATGHGVLIEGEVVSTELREAAWKTVTNLSQIKDLLY